MFTATTGKPEGISIMVMRFHCPILAGIMFAGLLALPACSSNIPTPKKQDFGQTVRGKVTYKGKPVEYGVVMFYNHAQSVDPQSMKYVPSVVAMISPDGTYETTNAVVGPVMIAVATDPDLDLPSLTKPTRLGGFGSDLDEDLPPVPPGHTLVNPLTEGMNEATKQRLKEIHKKYGIVGKSSLQFVVMPGEQTHDIELP